MATEREIYIHLVLLYLRKDTTLQRVQAVIPEVLETLARASKSAPEIAFRSTDAIVSGFLIETSKEARFIYHDLDRCTALDSGDSYFVTGLLEEKFIGGGEFSRAAVWLQHHKSR